MHELGHGKSRSSRPVGDCSMSGAPTVSRSSCEPQTSARIAVLPPWLPRGLPEDDACGMQRARRHRRAMPDGAACGVRDDIDEPWPNGCCT
jgi:hypothetical protein